MGPRLPGDDCARDWIWDRPVETATNVDTLSHAEAAWRRQLKHLLDDSPFYARKLRGGSKARLPDLAQLPFTNKQELNDALLEAPPFGSNAGVARERIKRVYQTSGTTGTPSVIALSAADIETWTAIGTRTYYATGIHDHHAVVSTFGAGPFVAGHTNFVLSRIGCRVVPVGPGDSERVLFAIGAGIADTMLATPSFAQHLANRPDPPVGLQHVVTGGEPGGGIPAVRAHLESALGASVNEIMGIGDVSPSLFGECTFGKGMHFCGGGHVWPELVDPDDGSPVAIETDAVGELVYTHLTREAMPVVRFRSGDVVRIEGTSCDCGRTSFRMRCLGRRDDMFIVRGVNVYPSAVVAIVAGFRPRVTGRARVIRPGADVTVEPPVEIEVEVPGEPADEALAAQLEAEIHARLTFRAKVELVPEKAFGASVYKTPLTVNRT